MDPELTALTSPAATTVQLLTAAWEQVTSVVGGLWRQVHRSDL